MYYFKFREELSKNRKNVPKISFGYDLKEKNKPIYDMLVYFDNLTSNAKKELDKIFEYSKQFSTNGINKEAWIRYVAAYKIVIPAMSKKIMRNVPQPTNGSMVSIKYAENKKEKELPFNDYNPVFPSIPNTAPSLFEKQIQLNKQGAIVTLTMCKEGTYENDIDLLYMVLDCLFSTTIPYYIKKCELELCGKYFVHSLPNKRKCNRMRFVYEKQTTCVDAVNTLYQHKEYRRIMRKDAKYLKHFHNDVTRYDIDKYNDEKNIIKSACIKKLNMNDFEIYIDNFYQSNSQSNNL